MTMKIQKILKSEYVIHPKFNPPLRYHEISLLKLNDSVTFNEYIKPICLETEKRNRF